MMFYGVSHDPYIFRKIYSKISLLCAYSPPACLFTSSLKMADDGVVEIVGEGEGEGGEAAAVDGPDGVGRMGDSSADSSAGHPGSERVGEEGVADKEGAATANDTSEGPDSHGSPPPSGEPQPRKPARAMVVTPSGPAVEPTSAPSGRRVSFQQDASRDLLGGRRELPAGLESNDLKVPSGRYTPSISPSPTPGLPPTPSDSTTHSFPMRYHWKKRDSEWVFRPLKLKFKVKELEELYRSYVYRQQQSLLCTACLIMMFLSAMVVIFFFANTKVNVCSLR